MADLVTRLRLDDKQFNDRIRRSRAEIQKFKKSGAVGKQGISTLLTAFKGMAAGVTIATTAMAVFKTAVNSSASSQERMAKIMGTAKTTVNQFFNSIKSGDWSFFKKGIVEAIKLAGDYEKAMKAIKQGTPLFNNYKDYKDAKLDNLNNRIENPNASKSQKEAAWKEYQDVYRDQSSTISQAEKGLQEKIKTVVKRAGITLKNNMDFENLFKANTATASGLVYSSDVYDRYKELLSEGLDKPIDEASFFKKEKALGYSDTYEGQHSTWAQKRINALEEIKAIEQYHPDVVMLYKMKQHLNEEEMKSINDAISSLSGVRSNLESRTTEYNSLSTKFDKDGKFIEKANKPKTTTSRDNPKTPTERIAENGSIAKIDERISEIETKIKYEVDPQKRAELYKELQALQDYKIEIEYQYKNPDAKKPDLVKPKSYSAGDFVQAASRNAFQKLPSVFENLKEKTEELQRQRKALADINKEVEDLSKQKNDQFYGSVRTTANEVLNLGDTINNLKNIDWDEMNGWEQFATGMDILFSVIDGIKAVQSTWEMFTAIKTALGAKETAAATVEAGVVSAAEAEKAAAVAAGQTAQTAAAIAGGAARTTAYQGEMAAASAAAYAYIPFAGVGLAATQIATFQAMILAAMAVPAFAEGGIVQGTSFFGDKVIARVNSGEMILTKGQQYNLFKLLDGSNINGNPNQITFKLRGSDIYGSLTNFNKKYSKL